MAPAALPSINQDVVVQPIQGPSISGEMKGSGAVFQALGDVGQELSDIQEKREVADASVQGAKDAAGIDANGDPVAVKLHDPGFPAGAAYNHAALTAHLATENSDTDQNVQSIFQQNEGDPEKAQTLAKAYIAGKVSAAGTTFPEAMEDVREHGLSTINQYFLAASQKQVQVSNANSANVLQNRFTDLSDRLQQMAFQGLTHTPQYQQADTDLQSVAASMKNPALGLVPAKIDQALTEHDEGVVAQVMRAHVLATAKAQGEQAGLQEASKVYWSDQINAKPEQRNSYVSQAQRDVRSLFADNEQDKAEKQRQFIYKFTDAQAAAESGADPWKVITHSDMAFLPPDEQAHYAATLDNTANIAGDRKNIALVPWSQILEQQSSIAQGTQADAGGGQANALKRLDAFTQAVNQRSTAVSTDAAGWVYSHRPDLGSQITSTDPVQRQAAARAALQIQSDMGVPAARQGVLPKAMADGLADQMLTPNFDASVGGLKQWAAGFTPPQISVLARQIAPKDPTLAAAVSIAPQDPVLASNIIAGHRFLKQNPDAKPADTKTGAIVDQLTGGSTGWFNSTGGLFQYAPDARSTTLAAATALYARGQIGAKAGTFDPDAFTRSVKQVVGEPFNFRGQIIVAPRPNMTASGMTDVMNGLNDREIQRFGNGQPIDALGRKISASDIAKAGVLTYTGAPGLYRVRFPGQGHLGVSGNPNAKTFTLNIGAMMGAN